MKKYKKYIILLLLIAAAAATYFWYTSPITTEIKDVYFTEGETLFNACTVNTYRDGRIIANVPPTYSTGGEFSTMQWNNTNQKWDPIYN